MELEAVAQLVDLLENEMVVMWDGQRMAALMVDLMGLMVMMKDVYSVAWRAFGSAAAKEIV